MPQTCQPGRLFRQFDCRSARAVWIADGDPHYVVRAQIAPTDDAKLTMTFSEFGKQVTATKPAV